jgi:excisionase family DNA binding protein
MTNSVQENRGRSVEEFAERLGLSKAMTYRLVNRGEIPCLRFGKRIIIPERVIEDLLAKAG